MAGNEIKVVSFLERKYLGNHELSDLDVDAIKILKKQKRSPFYQKRHVNGTGELNYRSNVSIKFTCDPNGLDHAKFFIEWGGRGNKHSANLRFNDLPKKVKNDVLNLNNAEETKVSKKAEAHKFLHSPDISLPHRRTDESVKTRRVRLVEESDTLLNRLYHDTSISFEDSQIKQFEHNGEKIFTSKITNEQKDTFIFAFNPEKKILEVLDISDGYPEDIDSKIQIFEGVESLNEFIDFDNLGDHRPNIINYLFQK
ncbi:MAG: hypothetical protein HRT47_06515 [Candidatus Caenarcaniphilales bacterium]|nr:hypothetical protein [Candidatus Caenarcaniphilales bacterium]